MEGDGFGILEEPRVFLERTVALISEADSIVTCWHKRAILVLEVDFQKPWL